MLAEKPGKTSGWNTTPTVQVSASSGWTSGLPPEAVVTPKVVVLPGLRGSRTLAKPPVRSNRSDTNSTGQTNEFAGSVGALPYADFKATASFNYRNGPFSGLVQARYTDDGYQNACGVPGNCITRLFYEDNDVPAVTYVDLRFGYQFDLMGAGLELSANVTNLFDVDPPLTPAYIGLAEHAAQSNAAVYDTLGRRYTLGLKVRM